MIDQVRCVVNEIFHANLESLDYVGGGMAGGNVYKAVIDTAPYTLAVKTAKHADMLHEECFYIKYISQRVDIKLPKIYAEHVDDECNFMIMEYFDGYNCASDYLINSSRKNRLKVAAQLADNVIKLQEIKGDKYGELDNPIYDSWHDYYRPFVDMVQREAEILLKGGYIKRAVMSAIKLGVSKYDMIFDEPISPPTMIHGDYWAQNVMIDKDYNLIGVVDPFNCMWADSEYELFALNAVYGKKLPVLEAYLARKAVSTKFMLKNQFYILMSEVYWVVKLHHDNNNYLKVLVREFYKQLKAFGLK